MKKVILSALAIFVSFVSFSQTNTYFELNGGYYFNNMYHTRLGIEFQPSYKNSFAFYGDIYIPQTGNNLEMLIGPTYKILVFNSKSITFKIPVGSSIGVNNSSFIGALQTGFQLDFLSSKNFMFSISQTNQLGFNTSKKVRFGIDAGISIPIN